MELPYKIPFYARTALIFISVFAFVFVLYLGRGIIVPLVYAILLAILLNPLVNLFMRWRFNKVLSICIAVTIASAVLLGILYIVSSQLSMFSETYPQLKLKFNAASVRLVHWVSETFNIRGSKINAWIIETQNEQIHEFAIGEKLSEIGHLLVAGMLLPVYLFLFLYYKPLLLEFIRRLFGAEHDTAVTAVLSNTKQIIQTYLVGLCFEVIIMAALNSAGLLLLGIDYAIMLGIIGAVLNIIPYIGGLVSTILPMTIAFITKDSVSYAFLVLALYIVIQFIDNNYIVPRIVAARVKINALISVIVVLIGGAVWGISGMFLSIPLTAIIKVIFDHIEPMKPWGFLLGNIVPTVSGFSFNRYRVLQQRRPKS